MAARSIVIASLIAISLHSAGRCAPNEAQRDNVIGSWGGQCSDSVQCWIDIDPIGKDRYQVTFKAADRQNAEKVLCTFKTTMERGGPDFISGRFGSSLNAGIFIKKPGVVVVHGAPSNACSVRLNIDGEYNVIGD